MKFDSKTNRYASGRNTVYAKGGMCCSVSPLGSGIGAEILRKGGNAMDAAIAMAAAMPLLEPTGNSLGSDCFVIAWMDGKLYGLDGSGVSPKGLSRETVLEKGFQEVPKDGWLPVMVPGAPKAWAVLRQRFGTMSMQELMAPAIRYAEEGFPFPVTGLKELERDTAHFQDLAEKEPELFGPWLAYFTRQGRAFGPGEVFRNPDMAKTLRTLAETDCEAFYSGEVMRAIVDHSRKTGGYFCEEDFTGYNVRWADPVSTEYHGYTVHEMPPNGHGITALMALNILKNLPMDEERETTRNYHHMIEAVKLAFADTKKYVADPRFMKTKTEDLLSEEYARRRRLLIGERAIEPEAGNPCCGGTVYFSTADREGNMVSFIQSHYDRGSGIAVPGTGITLQNRGAGFSMDPDSDNVLEGGKKCYHTIIPGFLTKDGKPVGPFGVMGGFMQPQGHVQVVLNAVDFHMNPQECLDAPRFQWVGGRKVQLERTVPAEIAEDLQRMGHEIEIVPDELDMGRGQIIWNLDGVYAGGTEPRADGTIAVI
ncbi:MAG: gamma-glutamyltransferase family protein [Firmicutes bacterium]|nr:gamma-glutamyltransferase family protein [Bacillota bacterium]